MMRHLLAAVAALFLLAPSVASAANTDPENTIYMDVPAGRVVIQLRPDLAPKHVAQIKALTRKGFYDGTPFHRVIAGFMAQGGDPTGTGTGGSDLPDIPGEFTDTPFVRGTVGMARAEDKNSANSQFFICFDTADFLDGDYTVWGEVVSGMEFIDALAKGEPPANPDRIVRMQVAADAK
jgi:cyclophilin family peptidyl-prolyl cis-trans isomerase